MFLLCSLPIVTVGWAWAVAVKLGGRELEERELRCFQTLRESFNKRGLTVLAMGALDIIIILLLFLSVITLVWGRTPLAVKLLNAFFFWLNTITICSGMYRYPLAVFNEDLSFAGLYVKGFFLVFSKPGYTFLFSMAFLSVFLVSVFTGLGLFVFLPGASAMLSVTIYRDRTEILPPAG
ncbi:MAG: hypothetical protein LBG07_00175 [Treponema sp.]|nr:hypothetical protein [Treponema sp.]